MKKVSVSYLVKMKGKKLNKEILVKAFEDLGYVSKSMELLAKGICLDYFEELGFLVYLTDGGDYPYNRWDTIFYEKEFIVESTLDFHFNKQYEDNEKRYWVMLSVVFTLMMNIGEEAILISNYDTELCLFKENGQVLLNNQNGIWKWGCFKDFIAEYFKEKHELLLLDFNI